MARCLAVLLAQPSWHTSALTHFTPDRLVENAQSASPPRWLPSLPCQPGGVVPANLGEHLASCRFKFCILSVLKLWCYWDGSRHNCVLARAEMQANVNSFWDVGWATDRRDKDRVYKAHPNWHLWPCLRRSPQRRCLAVYFQSGCSSWWKAN